MNAWWKAATTPGWHWVGWVQCMGGGALILGALAGIPVPSSLVAVAEPIFVVGLTFVLRDVAQYRATAQQGTPQEDTRS